MDPTQSRRLVRPTLTPRIEIPPRTGCQCCSCGDEVDEFCREHGGPSSRCCEDCRSVGITLINSDVIPVSVQQKRAGIDD
jgi:hypothetical protein